MEKILKMRRALAIILVVMILLLTGCGTGEDPYQIADAAQLELPNQPLNEDDSMYRNAYYILTADISLNDTSDFDFWAEHAPRYTWEPMDQS